MTDQTTEPVTKQQETITKQKNPLRIEQGKKLVEYNRRKKEELKRLNEQITKQDNMAEHKPKPDKVCIVCTISFEQPEASPERLQSQCNYRSFIT